MKIQFKKLFQVNECVQIEILLLYHVILENEKTLFENKLVLDYNWMLKHQPDIW